MVRFLRLLMAVNGGVGGAGAGGVLAAAALSSLDLDGAPARVPVMVVAVGAEALFGTRLGVGLGRGLVPRRWIAERP